MTDVATGYSPHTEYILHEEGGLGVHTQDLELYRYSEGANLVCGMIRSDY